MVTPTHLIVVFSLLAGFVFVLFIVSRLLNYIDSHGFGPSYDKNADGDILDKDYRKCIYTKFNEIEKHWIDKLKKIPRLPELKNRYIVWFSQRQVHDWEAAARIREFGGTGFLFSTTEKGRRWRMDGIEFRFDKSAKGIFMTYENVRDHLTDKEKEWVVLNYENILKPRLTFQYDNMLELVAKNMEQTEAKMFTALSVKV